MEQDISERFEEQGKKIDAVYASVEKIRSYFFWTLVLTVAFFVLPLIGLMFAVPFFLNTMASAYGL